MASMVIDSVKWYSAYLDTPMWMQERRESPEEQMKVPGCCVCTHEREGEGFPKHHGILVSYNEAADHVVVRGHDSAVSPRFVWTGTKAEYFRTWACD